MIVKTWELKEGLILEKDVFSITNRPIIPSKTVLTKELIDVLQAFLIEEVHVKNILVDGTPFKAKESRGIDEKNIVERSSFSDKFLQTVREYKKEFLKWQSGLQVDVAKIRTLLLPLIDEMETSSSELFFLHHYSTEKEYLYQHSIATGLFSAFIGKKLNYSKGRILQLALAGCLADCGMAKIPASILNKKGSLTEEEFNEIKQHPSYSFKMVQGSPLLREEGKLATIQHHERLDGSGYPLGLKGDSIHPFAKIIAVADTFHAMTSARLYKKKQSPFKVLEMINEDNFGKFDITVIKALQSGIMNVSIGSKVKLSNGLVGEILFIEEKSPTRPLIKLFGNNQIIHLEKHRDIFIEEILL